MHSDPILKGRNMGTKDNFSELDPAYQGKGLKLGIVMSRFNRDI